MKNVTDLFVEYLTECGNRFISDAVYAKAESCFIDYIGITYMGRGENGEVFKDMADESGYGEDGGILKKRVDYAKGDSENLMSRQEIEEKFKM